MLSTGQSRSPRAILVSDSICALGSPVKEDASEALTRLRDRPKCLKPKHCAAGPPVYIDSGAFYHALYGSLSQAYQGECGGLVSSASSHRHQGTIWTFLLDSVNLFSWDTCDLRTCSLTRSRRNSEFVSFSIFGPEN